MKRQFIFEAEPFRAEYEFDEFLDASGEYDEAFEFFDPELDEGWLDEARASSAAHSIPKLIKSETQPPAATLYAEIGLKIIHRDGTKGTAPMTGIFIPANYKPKATVDLILYLHGHKGAYPGARVAIDGYWSGRKAPFYFPLREELNQSNKNVILVAPTLGPHSEYGLLTEPTRFNRYLDQVMAALKAYGPYKTLRYSPGVGKIILACHSGGGSPMFKLAKLKGSGGYADRILECWGFDCLYANKPKDPPAVQERKQAWLANEWAKWKRLHPEAKLFIYYLGSTAGTSKKLRDKNLPNVFVEWSKTAENLATGGNARGRDAHFWVPKAHWRHRIQQARFLRNR
jgi:hypothetical protein